MKTATWQILMCAAVTALAAGCSRGAESDDAEDAVETSIATSSESALMSAAGEESTADAPSLNDDQIAQAASGRFLGKFKNGCVTATRNLNVVTYVMVNCTGPYGLVTVSGTFVVTYTRQANGSIKADGVGNGLKVNNGTLDLLATALYTKDAVTGVETIGVETHGKGVGPRGHTADRVGNYTVLRDKAAGCVSLEGTWSTKWDGSRATSSTEVTGLQKCSGQCPAAGGVIKHTGVFGKVITLTLDGSATAQWSSTNGRSGSVNLQCR